MNDNDSRELIVLGDEAVSYAVIDAGLKGAFAYPGTPSTEIMEGIKGIVSELDDGRVAEWAANEKVAYELALGVSYTGYRAMVAMKHVGLNVAMDPFVNSAISGIRGGLIVVVADDPGMHSSQNEQDTRYLANFANLLCLEPSTIQEAYDYTYQAFDLSEQLNLPIVLRLVTRLAHCRGVVSRVNTQVPKSKGIIEANRINEWILLPQNARVQYRRLREKTVSMIEIVDGFNKFSKGTVRTGVVTAGMGRAYFDQLMREIPELAEYTRLNICAYPLNRQTIRDFLSCCDRVFVFEENYPYIEDIIIDLAHEKEIKGRRSGAINLDGELDPTSIRKALKLPKLASKAELPGILVKRPPRLCDGCGHQDSFKALRAAMKNIGINDSRIFGDIGCYTLGALPPFDSLHSCINMGSSVGMALGAALAGMTPAVGVIGDSTFFHSGLPALLSLAQSKVNANLVIMDNRITAMTGHQKTVATDLIEGLVKSCGFSDEQIHLLIPLPKKHQENVALLERVLISNRPDVIIFKRECVEAMRKGLYKDNVGQG